LLADNIAHHATSVVTDTSQRMTLLDCFTGSKLIFGRPFVKRFALCYRTVVCPVCPDLSVCNVGVLWPNGWMDQDATWQGGRSRPRPHCVRRGSSSSPPRKGHRTPLFSAHVYCGHGRPSQLLQSSWLVFCSRMQVIRCIIIMSTKDTQRVSVQMWRISLILQRNATENCRSRRQVETRSQDVDNCQQT